MRNQPGAFSAGSLLEQTDSFIVIFLVTLLLYEYEKAVYAACF